MSKKLMEAYKELEGAEIKVLEDEPLDMINCIIVSQDIHLAFLNLVRELQKMNDCTGGLHPLYPNSQGGH